MIVIMLNDYPVEAMASRNSDQDAKDRCDELKQAYLKLSPQVNPLAIRYWYDRVPFFDPYK
jgi:hypothetical protein